MSNIRQHRHQSLRGSITVEASFVFPFVIFLMFSLIYLSFYLHDLCKIQGAINQVSHRAALMVKHESDIISGEIDYGRINKRGVFYFLIGNTEEDKKQILKHLQNKLSKGLFLIKVKNTEIKLTKSKLIVSVETSTPISMKAISVFFGSGRNRTLRQEYRVHNPAETLRQTEVILDTGSKIKGVDAMKEKLEGFLQKK